jgi:hypothetical protein
MNRNVALQRKWSEIAMFFPMAAGNSSFSPKIFSSHPVKQDQVGSVISEIPSAFAIPFKGTVTRLDLVEW